MNSAQLETSQYDDDEYPEEPTRVSTVDDAFERGAALTGLRIRVQSRQFRSGRVTAALAGVTVDLREAELSPEGATLYVQSALSGIDILVPPEWEVICDVDAVCAGVGEDRFASKARREGPRLRVTGTIVAGGLSVR